MLTKINKIIREERTRNLLRFGFVLLHDNSRPHKYQTVSDTSNGTFFLLPCIIDFIQFPCLYTHEKVDWFSMTVFDPTVTANWRNNAISEINLNFRYVGLLFAANWWFVFEPPP